MITIAQHQEHLDRLGLTTFDGVKTFSGDLVKDHHGRRDIFRIPLPGGGALYLKRNWQPHKKDGLLSRLTRGQVWSISRVEWENSLALQRAGLRTAALVAYGEECGPLWEKFSFLITEAADGTQPLRRWISTCRDPAQRRRVFDALARQIRRLHDAGLASPDLYTRHIFVNDQTAQPQFCLIDMARLDRKRNLPDRLRARDLAALHLTAPLRDVSVRERLRFLHAYAGKPDKRLAQLITRRAQHLRTRRKFQMFDGGGR